MAVTGAGDVISCSPEQQRDLFEATLAGQGQCAIITRATLRLERAARQVREYVLPYPDLQTLISDGTRVTLDGRFDGAVALIALMNGQWTYALTSVKHFTTETPDDAELLAGLQFIRGAEKIRDLGYFEYLDEMPPIEFTQSHADLGLLMQHSRTESFIEGTLPRFTPDDLGGVQGIRLFLWKRASFTRPLLRTPTGDADTLAQTLAGNRALYDLNRKSGGTLYPFAAVELTRQDWRRHYGSAWRAFQQAKRRYDPDAVLASGPNLYFT